MAVSITAQIFAIFIAIIASTAFYNTATAQAPAPGPSAEPAPVDCFTPLLNMSDCLTYVSKGSNTKVPDKACCPELAGLVGSSPLCLCQLLSNPGKLGFDIDVQRAIELPAACNVKTPPVSFCSLLGYPVGASPGSAPAPAPTLMPQDAGGSTTTPPPGNNGNKASGIKCFHLGFPLSLAFAFFQMLI